MRETADVIVVGAGVQGASLAFHLARRGARVVVLERETVAAGATGRSSGFVRMHYDLESESRLAWASFPYFTGWADLVGAGDPGFVRTGFLMLVTLGGVGIWWLADLIMLITGQFRDKDGRRVTEWI